MSAWMYKDPECGLTHDEFGGTYVYEDTGKTLADDYPDGYFQCPDWVAWLVDFTARIHGAAANFAAKWDADQRQ